MTAEMLQLAGSALVIPAYGQYIMYELLFKVELASVCITPDVSGVTVAGRHANTSPVCCWQSNHMNK